MNIMTTEIKEISSIKIKSDNKLNYFNAEWAVGLNRKVLNVYGLSVQHNYWQKIISNIKTFSIGIILFTFVIIPQTLALIKVRNQFNLVVDNLIVNLPQIIGEFKLLVMWKYKKVLGNIFKEIEDDWDGAINSQEVKIMVENAKIGRLMTICSVTVAIANVIVYESPLLFGCLVRNKSNLTDQPDRLIPIQAYYPYDLTPYYLYYFTFLGQLAGVLFGTAMYASTDALFATLVLHLCGRIETLANQIQEIIGSTSSNFQKIFNLCIKKHCQLLSRVQVVEQVFGSMVLALFALVAGTFCVQGYQLVLNVQGEGSDLSIMQILCYGQFLSSVVFLMFLYSWTGENLVTQNEKVHAAAYNCNWISAIHKNSPQIILLLLRTQHPLLIRAGNIIPLTLNTFLQFMKTSVGYISCLRATTIK